MTLLRRLQCFLFVALLCGCVEDTNQKVWCETDYVVTTTNGERRIVEFHLGGDGNVKWRLGRLEEQ